MRQYKIEMDDVYFAGDLHGEFEGINTTVNTHNLTNCALIICGDIGIGFDKEEYYNQRFNHIEKTLTKRNIHLFLFRGNHDSKTYFDGEHFTDKEYIHVIPDYSVISTPSRNILCVGGATSIDRTWRKTNMDVLAIKYKQHHSCTMEEALQHSQQLYWDDEAIVFDEYELKAIDTAGLKIDTVCTHTAPSQCQPITKNGIDGWLKCDPSLGEELTNERKVCDKLLQWLKEHNHPIKNWYYGHFHFHTMEIIDGIKFTLLNMFNHQILDIA